MKIAYVTDSGTGKNIDELAKEGIFSVPLQIAEGNTTYQDGETISIEQCLKMMHEQKVMTTSQPSLGLIEDLFQNLKDQGYDMIIAVPICSGLSGTISAFESTAARLDIKIKCIDTYVTAVVEEYIVKRIKEANESGKYTDAEIDAIVNEIINSTNTIIMPHSLKHLARSGRLTSFAATLGGLLRIVPILQINKKTNGKIDVLDKVRTFPKAMDKLIELMKSENCIDEHYKIVITHVDNLSDARLMQIKMKAAFSKSDIEIRPLCNPVAIHCGPGALAIQYFKQV